MQEIVSGAFILRGLGGLSAAGVVALAFWLRRPVEPAAGVAAAMIALSWPLWELFQVLDAHEDVTTFSGMAVPYVVFIAIGLAAGYGARRIVQSRRPSETDNESSAAASAAPGV